MEARADGALAPTPLAWLHSRELDQEADGAARSHVPVLISGEPGVGKRFVAHAIHARSDRRRLPFIRMSCRHADRLSMPHGATVVLEEIDQLRPSARACPRSGKP